MHELGEIGIFYSKFRREKFANFTDAIEYITQKHYFLKNCRPCLREKICQMRGEYKMRKDCLIRLNVFVLTRASGKTALFVDP